MLGKEGGTALPTWRHREVTEPARMYLRGKLWMRARSHTASNASAVERQLGLRQPQPLPRIAGRDDMADPTNDLHVMDVAHRCLSTRHLYSSPIGVDGMGRL
jgi:hypothetical protein